MREATRADLAGIVALLADDQFGSTRELVGDPVAPSYEAGFAAIEADPHNELWVAECKGTMTGVFQLTFVPGIAQRGGWRAQIEAVRVLRGARGQGIGSTMMYWAIARARARGCHLVQLTTNRQRTRAHHFYEQLGFEASHLGMKLVLDP